MNVTQSEFGVMPDGAKVQRWDMTNGRGLSVSMIDHGATIIAVSAPDRDGKSTNITLGLDSLEAYLGHAGCFGCTVGRFANRIGGGRFTLDGKTHELPTNNGPNHLHGGPEGFARQVWQARPVREEGRVGVTFTYASPDGEMGYPGKLRAEVTYAVTRGDTLEITFAATTDAPTVVNLTNHAYWNLAGGKTQVFDHEVAIRAEHYLPTDEGLIPTGEVASVAGTPFDLRQPTNVGKAIQRVLAETQGPRGFDLCYVISPAKGETTSDAEAPQKLAKFATLRHTASGRTMEVWTTQPGMQFYSAIHLSGHEKNGGYPQYGALCFETQHWPDAPNQPTFPSTTLRPGEQYEQRAEYRFGVEP